MSTNDPQHVFYPIEPTNKLFEVGHHGDPIGYCVCPLGKGPVNALEAFACNIRDDLKHIGIEDLANCLLFSLQEMGEPEDEILSMAYEDIYAFLWREEKMTPRREVPCLEYDMDMILCYDDCVSIKLEYNAEEAFQLREGDTEKMKDLLAYLQMYVRRIEHVPPEVRKKCKAAFRKAQAIIASRRTSNIISSVDFDIRKN